MEIDYFSETRDDNDPIELYKALKWYGLPGYTDEEIDKARRNAFYSVYAYDGMTLVGLGRVASDGFTAAVMSGICVRPDYRRQGIGEQIVTRLVYHCQSGGYQMNVQLFCEDSLRPWYERQGFENCAMGMRKRMILPEDTCRLRKAFREIYGIEQITEPYPDFYWNSFDSFGEFRYTGTYTDGEVIPSLFMTFYCSELNFGAELDFRYVTDLTVSCSGVRTPLEALDIALIPDGDNIHRYKVHSAKNITFSCEGFHVISVFPINEQDRII